MDLRELQLYKLKVFEEFAAVCEQNGIQYFLYGGTLLGAVRHNGFIPWDDDIDVALLWDDYLKLLRILQKDLGEQYFVQNIWTESKYPLLWTQLRVNNTTSMPTRLKGLHIHWGICIDIFPLISMEDDDKEYSKQLKAFRVARSMLAKDAMKARGEKAVGVQRIINLLPSKTRHLIVDMILKKHASTDGNQKWLGGLDSAELKRKYKYEDFKSTKEYIFEDKSFLGPANADSVLTCNYGTGYMTPVPPSKQGGHDIELGTIINDLEHNYTEYL